MSANYTQFWDARLLYIYALLGGLVDTTEGQISFRILNLTNQQWSTEYCLRVLAKLENMSLIAVNDIIFDELQSYHNAIKRTGLPPSPHFMMTDPEQIKEFADKKMKKMPKATKTKTLYSLVSGNGRFSDEDKHDCIKFRIVVKDKKWFKDKVEGYLQAYEREELFTPNMCDSAPFSDQVTRLLQVLGPSQHERQIELSSDSMDAFDPENSYRYLETLFSLTLKGVLHLTYMDLNQHYALSQPKIYVHYKLLSTEPVKQLMHQTVKRQEAAHLAEIRMRNRQLFIELGSEGYALRQPFRTDSGLYNFMNHLLMNANEKLGRGIVNTLDGCKTFQDMTEIVRKCGFDPLLKDIFFPGTTKQVVFFSPKQLLTTEQSEQLIGRLSIATNRHK